MNPDGDVTKTNFTSKTTFKLPIDRESLYMKQPKISNPFSGMLNARPYQK